MEGKTAPWPHRVNVGTNTQSGDDETNTYPNVRANQPQAKHTEPNNQCTQIEEEEDLSTLTDENARLLQENRSLIADLEECKSELFKRIPPTQIADDFIQKAFERILGSIDSFVYDIMEDVVDDDALYRYCQKIQGKRKKKSRKSRNSLHDFVRNVDISAWGPFECSNFYILSVMIQWILDEFVFREFYPLGITDTQARVLKEVETGMWHTGRVPGQAGALVTSGQLSDRDVAMQEQVDLWRSETLTALTALRENEARLEEAVRKICNGLTDMLSPWLLHAGPFVKVEGRFRQEILDPAVKLHQHLKCSSHIYDLRHLTVFNEFTSKQMFDQWNLKDVDSWLKPRSEKEVGKALHCLHPSILRLRTRGMTPIVIAKPVIVVASPQREKGWSSYAKKPSLPGGKNLVPLPTAVESGHAKNQFLSSIDRETSTRIKGADSPSVSSDSDSVSASWNRRDQFNQRGAPRDPPGSHRRHSEVSISDHDLQSIPRSQTEVDAQSSGRHREDRLVRPYFRGHHIPGTSNTFPIQTTARQSRQGSRRSSVVLNNRQTT